MKAVHIYTKSHVSVYRRAANHYNRKDIFLYRWGTSFGDQNQTTQLYPPHHGQTNTTRVHRSAIKRSTTRVHPYLSKNVRRHTCTTNSILGLSLHVHPSRDSLAHGTKMIRKTEYLTKALPHYARHFWLNKQMPYRFRMLNSTTSAARSQVNTPRLNATIHRQGMTE